MNEELRDKLHALEADDGIIVNGQPHSVTYTQKNDDRLRLEIGVGYTSIIQCSPDGIDYYVEDSDPESDGFRKRRIDSLEFPD